MVTVTPRNTLVHRRVYGIVIAFLMSACTPIGLDTLQQDLTRAAQEQILKTLANQYTIELGKGISTVVAGLAKSGGYLDNPVARILLPPPLTMAFGIVRDLDADPQATLLSVLINQAAEQAIPGAAPILQAVLKEITPSEVVRLLSGDMAAGTAALKAEAGTALQAVLKPIISEQLATSGAILVYKEMLETYPAQSESIQAEDPAVKIESVHEAVSDLDRFVTERAVAGLFNVLADQETFIRNNVGELPGDILQGLGGTPTLDMQQSR